MIELQPGLKNVEWVNDKSGDDTGCESGDRLYKGWVERLVWRRPSLDRGYDTRHDIDLMLLCAEHEE